MGHGLSQLSAETGTLTIISTRPGLLPGISGSQLAISYLLGRIVICRPFCLPHYFRGKLFTPDELMRRRLASGNHKLTACIFLVGPAPWRKAYAIVISVVLGRRRYHSYRGPRPFSTPSKAA